MKYLKNLTIQTKARFFLLFGVLFSGSALAEYDIGTSGSGPLDGIVTAIQYVVNIVDGPIALGFSFFSITAMAIFWAVAPKMIESMGVFFRVLVACIVILNIGVWIAYFKGL